MAEQRPHASGNRLHLGRSGLSPLQLAMAALHKNSVSLLTGGAGGMQSPDLHPPALIGDSQPVSPRLLSCVHSGIGIPDQGINRFTLGPGEHDEADTW